MTNPQLSIDDQIQKIYDWSKTVGASVNDKVTQVDAKEAKLRLALIVEETKELTRDITKYLEELESESGKVSPETFAAIADDLGDILWVVLGAFFSFGFPVRNVVSTIVQANYTKLIPQHNPHTSLMVSTSLLDYDDKGIEITVESQGEWIVLRDHSGKLRKPVTFVDVNYEWLKEICPS